MKLNLIAAFLLLLGPSLYVSGQNYKQLDSLKNLYRTYEEDTNKINILLSIGLAFENSINDSAIYYYSEAQELSEKMDNSACISKCIHYKAYVYEHFLFDYKKSIECYLEAIRYLEKIDDRKKIADFYGNIGINKFKSGLYDESIEYFKKSAIEYESMGDSVKLSRCYNHIGIVYRNRNMNKTALEFYLKSLNIKEEIGDIDGTAGSCTGIGLVYLSMGEYDNALNYFKKALEINKELNNETEMAGTYHNMGLVYSNMGVYNRAIDNFIKAIPINKKLNNLTYLAENYNSLGVIYRNTGNENEAIKYYLCSSEIFEKLENKVSLARLYNNIGIGFRIQKNYNSAIEYFSKALNLNEQLGVADREEMYYLNLGNIKLDQEEYYEAIELYEKALNVSEKLVDIDKNATIYGNVSLCYIKLAEQEVFNSDNYYVLLNKALEFALEELKINIEKQTIKSLGNSYEKIYKIYKGLSDKNNAEKYIYKLVELDNSKILMNFSYMSEKDKEYYMNIIDKDFMTFNSFALERKKENPSITERVYNNAINYKGILLRSTTSVNTSITNSGDTLLVEKFNNWIELRKKITDLYFKPDKKIDIALLESKSDSIERELVRMSDIFQKSENLQNINWIDIRNHLKPNEAAIEFIHFKWDGKYLTKSTDSVMYCALVIRSDSKYPEYVPLFIKNNLDTLLSDFEDNNNINFDLGNLNCELYKLIWKPLEEILDGVNSVYLSPSGILNKISFASLAIDKNLYLLDNYDVNVLSSTGQLTHKSEDSLSLDLTTFGGINYNNESINNMPEYYEAWKYLKGTNIEVEKLTKLYHRKKKEINNYIGTNASETEFKRIAGSSSIMHIATHGFYFPFIKEISYDTIRNEAVGDIVFRGNQNISDISYFTNNTNPLVRTGLVFAGANDAWNNVLTEEVLDDGILTAQEVTFINMRNTDLVVLSACETGLGDIKGSEGVYGLQRAFKMAGVKYIIMSLWQVPDKETVEFMETFYKKLLKTNDVRLSFTETQKEMRKKYDQYYWAAFVLIE